MTFREIDQKMMELVDPETGEILDIEAFDKLEMDYSRKVENMALWILDLNDEAENIANEIKRLQGKKTSAENKARSLKKYLQIVTGKSAFKSDKISISFRNNEVTEVDDEKAVIDWAERNGYDDVLSYTMPKINKTVIKKLLKDNVAVPAAHLEQNVSTIIK